MRKKLLELLDQINERQLEYVYYLLKNIFHI